MPTDTKLDEKDLKHHLLNPELNSVYDEEQDAPITDDIFPDRSGFFTGHRIPLELFSKDTVQRLLAVSVILVTRCHVKKVVPFSRKILIFSERQTCLSQKIQECLRLPETCKYPRSVSGQTPICLAIGISTITSRW